MQRAEELVATAVALEQVGRDEEADESREAVTQKRLVEVHRGPQTLGHALTDTSLHRWLAAFVGFQLALAVALLLVGLFGQRRLSALVDQVQATRREAQAIRADLAGLTEETRQLKAENVELTQFLTRSAGEQEIFLKILVLKPDINHDSARTIARHVHHYAELYGKDSDIVLAIISVESRFDPNAVSPVGALGLMQVMPQWQKILAISGSLKDPETSIRYGLQILGFYLEMYKDMEMALTAYNRGPGPVDMALMKGRDPKNEYPGQVLKVYERLKKMSVAEKAT
ncbi:MAG: lytic transglycosylase domain-containing protein [Myxococcaceae bacterium]|nr:lytic transglycosylase domain-containing protein [Myxococcaceae bacterium]MCI0671228.1 lytic transglycosylase domain-containing protein [Myxococcaceae bacterium]